MCGNLTKNILFVPLTPISAFKEPFHRVLVDYVGPLLKAKSQLGVITSMKLFM